MKAPRGLYLSCSTGELGASFGYLVNPRTQIAPKAPVAAGAWWALDNDCFSDGLDIEAWARVLFSHLPHVGRCLFAVSPDVVGDYRATLALFDEYAPRLRALGYPVALATQDGLTPAAVPWAQLDTLFVGGSDDHKLGPEARTLIDEAQVRGKRVHVGRVNSRRRLIQFHDADSWDGTLLAFDPPRARRVAGWIHEARRRRPFEELAS